MNAGFQGGRDEGRGVLTVGGEVGQQHADALHHLRVVLVELVYPWDLWSMDEQ